MHSLYTDGSHALDLNIASIGGYLLDSNNKEVWSFSNPLYDNQPYHELKALDYALKRCLESGVKELICYTDCLSIVRDVANNKIKHNSLEYTELFNNFLKILNQFQCVEFEFIPREQNQKANLLARKVLTTLTSSQPRVKIFQSLDNTSKYFKSEKLYCSEQYVDKKKINNIKNNINSYYVFELYRENEHNILDIYHAVLKSKARPKQIFSYPLHDTWLQYISAVNQTLEQIDDPSVGIMLCPANNEIDMLLRGMKAVNRNYTYELDRLHQTLKKFKHVLIDSDTSIYQKIFQNYIG